MKTIILWIFLLVVRICMAKKEANFVRFGNCPEIKNCTTFYRNVTLTKDKRGKTVSMRFDLLVTKEIKRMLIVVTLRKCENSENLDSCEYYMKDFKVKNCCDMMGKKKQIWSDALDNSNFPKSCPIAAGIYNLNDTKLDSDMQLTLMPVPIALWKMRFLTYDSENDNALVSCTDMDVNVYVARRY